MPTGTPRQALYGDVLTIISRHGSTYAEQVASILKVSNRTARKILSDLLAMGIIVRVGTTRSPAIYEKTPKTDKARSSEAPESEEQKGGTVSGTVQTSEEEPISNGGCDSAPLGLTTRATCPEDVRDIPGFVASPFARPYQLSPDFGRAHYSGPIIVGVAEVGRTPETWALPDSHITGRWIRSEMKGNVQINGQMSYHHDSQHDNQPIKVQAMTDKAGEIHKMLVYPHWRWIRRIPGGTIEGIMEEMAHQTREVLEVLESMGWRFVRFEVLPGQVHYTLENGISQHVNHPYVWNDGDEIHYDRSMGYPEAEVYGSSPTANEDIDLMANLPTHIREMEDAIATANISIAEIADHTTTLAGHVTALTDTMTAMVDAVNVLVKMATPAKYEKQKMEEDARRTIYG